LCPFWRPYTGALPAKAHLARPGPAIGPI
jgi:hypothetical protein